MRCIFIGQHTRKTHALSDEDGAGAGIRTRTSSMACSRAAVGTPRPHLPGRGTRHAGKRRPRAPALRSPAHWQSTLLKIDPLAGPRLHRGAVLPFATANKNARRLASIRAFGPFTGSGADLACTPTRIDLARIPIDLRALVLDDWRICPMRGRNAAEAGHRFLGARQPGSSPVS